MADRLSVWDFLLIAESVLGIPAEELARNTSIPSLESALAAPFAGMADAMFYEDPVERAAICCSRLIRNHPLLEGNKEVSYECMREMLERARAPLAPPNED